MTLRSLYWKTVVVSVLTFTIGLFVAIGCGPNPAQDDEAACGALCDVAYHDAECINVCVSLGGSAAIEQGLTKEMCELTDPPPPPPDPFWLCTATCYVGDLFSPIYASEDCGIAGQPVVNNRYIPLRGYTIRSAGRVEAYTMAKQQCPSVGYNHTRCYRMNTDGTPGDAAVVSCISTVD